METLEHVINMGIIEDLAGKGINSALQVATANVTDEEYANMVELLYETGGAIQDIADILADRKLSPDEIDQLVRGLYKDVSGIQLEAVKSAIDRIVVGIGR